MPYSSRSALPSALPQARSCVVIGVDLFLSLPSSPRVLIPLSGCCPATTLQRKKRSRTRYARRCRRRGHTHPPAWVHRASPPAPTRAVSHPRAPRFAYRLSQRITIWHTIQQRKIVGNAAPMAKNLQEYLDKHKDCEVYKGQDHPEEPKKANPMEVRPSVRPHTRRHLGLLRSVALRPPLLTPTHPVAPPLCLGSSDGPDG